VDVENSEHLVLEGISDNDWKKIDSLVIEVHDVDDRLNKISELLKKKDLKHRSKRKKCYQRITYL
jgi:hypothetical protein